MTTMRFSDFAFRLRLKWMWLRHTHPFNWAHKPLCSRFQSGVLQIGKLHVCRSCLFAYCGIVLGSITAFVHPNMIANMKLTWLMLALTPIIILSYPRLYKRFPRYIQDVLRLAMGLLVSFIPFLLIYGNFTCGLTSAVVMVVFWRVYFHQRRIRKMHACDGCPELNQPEICSGFQKQTAAIRLYEIEATDFLYRIGRGFPNLK